MRALALPTVDEVFQEVEAGTADFGVVAIENSSEGTITNTLDRFLTTPLHICGEVELRIHHCLMGKMDALAARACACARTARHWRSAAAGSTSICRTSSACRWRAMPRARAARATSRARAAIAGDIAAEVYGLNMLAREIEDHADNTTRFLVLGRKLLRAERRGSHHAAAVGAATRSRPGALQRLLEPFARYGISMTRIESRPSRRRKWDYVFFIDIEGHAEDAHVARRWRR